MINSQREIINVIVRILMISILKLKHSSDNTTVEHYAKIN